MTWTHKIRKRVWIELDAIDVVRPQIYTCSGAQRLPRRRSPDLVDGLPKPKKGNVLQDSGSFRVRLEDESKRRAIRPMR